MATPEGRVKKAVKEVLALGGERVFYDMPVPSGYGKSTLDFWGFCDGKGFVIETKARGQAPTPRQIDQLVAAQNAGAAAFVIDGTGPEATAELRDFILGGVQPTSIIDPGQRIL